jgi:hypothetical protein
MWAQKGALFFVFNFSVGGAVGLICGFQDRPGGMFLFFSMWLAGRFRGPTSYLLRIMVSLAVRAALTLKCEGERLCE